MRRTVILGIGNPYVSDDGAGIYVVRELESMLQDDRVVCRELATANLDVLECLQGFDEAIIIDAARFGMRPAGFLSRYSLMQAAALLPSLSFHTIALSTALSLGVNLGMRLPSVVNVYAVEVADTETFREGCTGPVRIALPGIAETILLHLKASTPDLHYVLSGDRETVTP